MKARKQWIDILRAIAVFGVVTNHIPWPLFPKEWSVFCVTLFIIISGITSALSLENRKISYKEYIIKKIKLTGVMYLVASVIYVFTQDGYISGISLGRALVTGMSGPLGHLYYLIFWFELAAAAPFIVKLYECYDRNIIKNILLLTASCGIGILMLKYTYFEFWALGSKYFLGATYFFAFNFGVFFWFNMKKLFCHKGKTVFIMCAGTTGMYIYVKSNAIAQAWTNPPTANTLVYSLLIFTLAVSLTAIGAGIVSRCGGGKTVERMLVPILFLGKNTLIIYIYHVLVMDTLTPVLVRLAIPQYLKAVVLNLFALYLPPVAYMCAKKSWCLLKKTVKAGLKEY